MPIKILEKQRRMAEKGRIRLGYKQGGNGRPVKLETFRFTSASEQAIKDLAGLYGGTPQPWDNSGKPEFQVTTEAKSIPVIVVKGGLSQWMETWTGGGCVHRCDGEVNVLTNEACDPDDPHHVNAKPTTRLSVMLPELESIGWWRMESHGWNSAAELPTVAELAQFVGDLVPASLDLVERRAIKDGKTSRFVVPVLDLKIATHRLREIVEAKVNGGVLEAGGAGARPALEAGSSAGASTPPVEDPYQPYFDRLAACKTFDEAQALWSEALAANLVGEHSVASPRREEFFAAIREAGSLPKGEPQPDADGAYPIDVVEDQPADADAVWKQIVEVGGGRGMTLGDIEDDFAQKNGGLSAGEASATELQAYLSTLTEGAAA